MWQTAASDGVTRKGSAVPGALEFVLSFGVGIAVDGNPGIDSDSDPERKSGTFLGGLAFRRPPLAGFVRPPSLRVVAE